MKKTLTAFLLFIFSVPAFAATYHGTVIDADDGEPVIAYACIKGTQSCAETDYTTGAFQIVVDTETRKNPQIEITAVGYKSQDINVTSVNNFGNILLHREHEEIEEAVHTETVVGTYCNSNVQNSLPTGHYVKQLNSDEVICKPDECLYNTYIVQQQSDGTFKCVLDPNIKDRTGSKCTGSELKKLNLEHATAGDVLIWDEFSDEVLSCTVTTCENGFTPNDAGTGCKSTKCSKCGDIWDNNKKQCVSRIGQSCSANNAKTATYQCIGDNEICKIAADGCNDGYRLDADNNVCISNNGQSCDPGVPGAIGYLHKQGDKLVCQIDACEDGYRLVKGKCEPRQKIDDASMEKLKANAQKMHEQENSLANKTLGAVGIGATGIGGMMVGAALSEQRLDTDSERAMRAYLETFRCEYGSGRGAKGGETNIELPGGNDMFNLYVQYANISSDLKARKSALGIKPGIESEIVIDKAETGLYDDVGTGITGGAYASVARALQNPDGEDAKLWAAQKQATADNLKTGAITAGVGAAASLVGNIAINSGKSKQNQVDNILSNAKYEPIANQMEKTEAKIESIQVAKQCPNNAHGDWPNCKCNDNNQYFDAEYSECVACDSPDYIVDTNNECKCPSGMTTDKNSPITCSPVSSGCQLTGDITSDCKCMTGATQNGNTCECQYGTENGKCKSAPSVNPHVPGTTISEMNLSADKLFDSGKWNLSSEADMALHEFVQNAITAAKENNIDLKTSDDYCLTIVGKTDRVAYKKGSTMTNKKLSENRANAVKEKIAAAFNEKNIKTYGIASQECTKQNYPRSNDARCRRVDVTLATGNCNSTTDNSNVFSNTISAVSNIIPAGIASTPASDTPKQTSYKRPTNDVKYDLNKLTDNSKEYVKSLIGIDISDTNATRVSKFAKAFHHKYSDSQIDSIVKLTGAKYNWRIDLITNNSINDTSEFCQTQLDQDICNSSEDCRIGSFTNNNHHGCSLYLI